MSLSPNEKYPGRVDVDPNYRDGKFKDSDPSTANNGSPLKAIDRNEQLALQEAVMDAAGFEYSGVADTPQNSQMFKAYKAALSNGANLLSNHNFLTSSPDDITHPNATPETYAAGTQIFSGVYAGDSGCTITLIDGRVNCTAGDYQFKVANTNGLDRVPVFASSVSDYDGKPKTTGVSHALVADEYVVTVTPTAGDVFSVKLEQGSVATGHKVGSISSGNLSDYTDIVYKASGGNSAVENMIADFALNPTMYAVGTIIKTGGTTFEYRDSTGPITLSNFRVFNGKCCFDFGIKGDGTPEDPAKMSEFLQLAGTLLFPDATYSISEAMEIQSNSRIFNDGKFIASGILVNEESVMFFRDCDNIEAHNLRIDCGLFPANSGVIIRDNTSQIRMYNTSVENAAWDATRGGGRGVIIEANSGSPADIIIDGLYCRNVDTPFALNGYTGARKNNVVVSNIVANDCEKLVVLFGNGAGYPHSGDSQSCVISNVTGNNIRQPLRFDRASNATISNFYVYNDNTVTVAAFIQGLCSNVVFQGSYDHELGGTTPSALYNNSSWKDDGTSPDEGFATYKSEFNIKQTGQVSNLLAQGLTRDQCFDTIFEIHSDVVASDVVSSLQFRSNTSVFVEVYNSENNARVTGFVDDIGSKALSSLSGEDYSPSRLLGDVKFSQKTMIPILDNDYDIGSDDKRLRRLYAREGVRVLAPNGDKYLISVNSAGAVIATINP